MGSFFNDVIHCKLCCYEFDKTNFPVLHLGWYSAMSKRALEVTATTRKIATFMRC